MKLFKKLYKTSLSISDVEIRPRSGTLPPLFLMHNPMIYFNRLIFAINGWMFAISHDIPCFFRGLTDLWGKNEIIKVSKGKRCQTLAIKKRGDYKRPTIHYGWIESKNALKLEVGDVCVFGMKGRNIRQFDVQVIEKTQFAFYQSMYLMMLMHN